MSYKISVSSYFASELKRLKKRYRSMIDDMDSFVESLQENPYQGIELAPNIRKIRLAITSKGKGKSGGARVITVNAIIKEGEGEIFLLLIYDKSDISNVSLDSIMKILKSINLKQ